MTHHVMQLSEPHPTRHGFIQRYYATVDVSMSGASWHWNVVDHNGRFIGSPSGAFPTEGDALDSALKVLNGDCWE